MLRLFCAELKATRPVGRMRAGGLLGGLQDVLHYVAMLWQVESSVPQSKGSQLM